MAALSCDSSTEPLAATGLEIVSGDGQEAQVGTRVPEPLQARVLGQNGQPMRGELVHFVVVSGGGSVHAGSAISDAEGLVQDQWTLGTSTASEQRVEVRLIGAAENEVVATASFTARVLPGPATTIEKRAGDGAEGTAGDAVSVAPSVV